ncbi:hypothetical protein D3C81_678140 [compost metagenome]
MTVAWIGIHDGEEAGITRFAESLAALQEFGLLVGNGGDHTSWSPKRNTVFGRGQFAEARAYAGGICAAMNDYMA